MGTFSALNTAVAGLQAQSFALQNISGNIANSETTGYKETDTAFADMVSAAALGEQTPDGVTASSVAMNTVQGTIQSTSTATDMAVNGDGFFVVAKPTGTADNTPEFSGVDNYTREGDFEMNSDGYLVNGSGYYLMGTPIDSATGNAIGSTPEVLQFDDESVPALATTEIQYKANLPSTPSSGVLEPGSFGSSPVAGAEALGSGATLDPDAAATATGTTTLTNSTTLASLGITTGTISVNDGTNTTTFTVGTDGTTVGSLISFINSSATGNAAASASLNSNGELVITGQNDTDTITLGGSSGNVAALGFGSTTFAPTNLLTQGVSGSLTVQVAGGSTQTITFGTGTGDVATMAQLQSALQNLVGVTGSVDTSNGNITLLTTNPNASLTIGGTSTPFGIANGTVSPSSGAVTGSDATTFTDQSISGGSVTAYDSEGNPVDVQFRWAQVSSSSGGSTWQLYYQTDSNATGSTTAWQNAGQTFSFNSSGEMSPAISNVTLQNLTVNGDNLGNVQVSFGTNGLTQFADSSANGQAQVNTVQQNGNAAGTLQSIAVNNQNQITGTFSNGQTIALAQITLATFAGADSLQAVNGNAYAATTDSGSPIYGAGGTVEGSSLESSNVDLSTQFSDLIVTQQAYSANARVMQTADQMIQSLMQVIQ